MTLEDFFTLTEMNNGLTVPSRVKELVTVMQKERDCVVKNVGEATRQWSAVGSVIAATENQDCLDLFVQLDGLQFVGTWLKNAQALINDSNDSFVEESITHLLQALGKLQLDYEKLVATETLTTVKDLLVHSNSKIQDKARILFENWKTKKEGDESLPDVEQSGGAADDTVKKSKDIERGNGHSEVSKEKSQEPIRDDPLLSPSSDAVNPCHIKNSHNADKKSDTAVDDVKPPDHVCSPSMPKGATSIESYNSAVSRQDTLDVRTESNELETAGDIKHTTKNESSTEKHESPEEFHTPEDRPFSSSSDAVDGAELVTETGSQKFSAVGESSSFTDSMKIDSDGKVSMNDTVSAAACRSSSALAAEQGGENIMSSQSSIVEKSWENTNELNAFLSGIKNHGKIKKLDPDLANDYKFAKKGRRRELDHVGKKSDAELYGIVDPLEVARQVAMEVERECVDDREHSCSSSQKLQDNALPSDSLESVSGKQSRSDGSLNKEVENDPDVSSESSLMQEESATSAENLETEQTNGQQNVNTSKVIETAQEESKTEKGLCNFDLNEEICPEDGDRPANQFSTPVSIVSASRAAAAASGQPVAPLQFEGNLGWKGSAATSAFRPASPRKMLDSEKDLSSSSSSKQRLGFLDIDLNVAGSTEGRAGGDQSPDKTVPLFSCLPSGESSVETNSRKSELLELDLNRTSEDGSRPLEFQMGQFYAQSLSSSSSSKQPSLKNIDLNDQPSFLNDSSDNSYLSKFSHNFNLSGGMKSDDSVISIMGKRVEVNRKDAISPCLTLQNGRTSGLAFDVNLGKSGNCLGLGSVLPYTHSTVYGYNNIASGPSVPFPSAIYGSGPPIPYMVDSRGAPVIPQIVGSASALPNFSQTPFFINMAGPSPSNGIGAVGPSRSNFDLNSDGGSREPAGFTQFLSSGQIRPMDDQLRLNHQQTMNSVIGTKRKEPENGWEHYPFKHYTPPWK